MSDATRDAELSPDSPAAPTACSILVEWANAQDHWVRRIVRTVIESRQPLQPEVVEEIYRSFRIEKGLDTGEPDTVPPLDVVAGEPETIESFRVKRLGNVEGVNALAEKQEITFNDGLTILFGENACGKTGYVRILKTLAAVRTNEPVLGNVHETAERPKKAQLQYRLGATEEAYDWAGATGVVPFTRMNVFDSDAVAIHVDDDLSYAYTPRDLALFRYVTEAIDGIKSRLEKDRDAAKLPSNPFVHRFERDTRAYQTISVLDAATDLAEVRALANLSEEEVGGLSGLREQVEALRPESTQTQLQLGRSKVALLTSIAEVAAALAGFDAEGYERDREALREALEAFQKSSATAFAAESIPAVLGTEWRDFIDAAERYIEATHAHDYPSVTDACVYCRQPLSEAARALIAKYRSVSRDTTRQRFEAARERLASRQRVAEAIGVERLRSALQREASLIDDTPEFAERAVRLTDDAQRLVGELVSGAAVDLAPLQQEALALQSSATTRLAEVATLVETLTAKADERKRLHTEAAGRLRDLEGRILLRHLLPDVETYLQRAKWLARCATIAAKLPAIQRALTDASKTASETLLNTDFEQLFSEESKALRAPAVKLYFPGRKGEPARRKTIVPRHKLSEILSEGEQKVIALADFLAEARLRSTAATIVFDDPVNSLDYKRIREVVARIAALSRQQQVIVFTHNIWFAVELLSQFEKVDREKCSYYDVSADEMHVGIVTKGTHPRWDTPKEIGKRINALISQAEKLSGDIQQFLLEKGYDLLRTWCEAAVEQDLLCGVAQRYQPNIMMTKLPQIRTDRLPAAIGVIEPIFEKACRLMGGHSQPLETLSIRPSLAELKEDWKTAQDAHTGYMK